MQITDKTENLEERKICRTIRAEVDEVEVKKEITTRIKLSQKKKNLNFDTGLHEGRSIKVLKMTKVKGNFPDYIKIRFLCKIRFSSDKFGQRFTDVLKIMYFDEEGLPLRTIKIQVSCEFKDYIGTLSFRLPDLEEDAVEERKKTEAVEERKIEVEPETDKTEKLADLGEDKTDIEDQKETAVTQADKPDQPEIVEEDETLVKGEGDSREVATISKELSELKKLPLEELKALEKTIPESAKNKTISLGKILKGFKLDTKNLNLKNLRKQGEISKTGKVQVGEVITKNSALFAKGKSKIARKIKKLGVVQSSNYGQVVYSYIVEQWTLPAQLSPHLELKLKLIIAKDGTLLQYSFVKVSGNRIFDQSLKSVFAKFKTLPPLPDDFDGKLTEIGLKFTPNMENISYKILVE
mgnify:CR=1 FL=1